MAARDLDAVVERLHGELGLGEPYADPGVGYFGLRNAVFALGDTFLEVVSPMREDAPAARLLSRRAAEVCGYMLMFQVDDLPTARSRVDAAGVRVVFDVSLDDMSEVHLHPGDMRGAIVSLSAPVPPESWRWGGPDWSSRALASASVSGARVAVADSAAVRARWEGILGGPVPDVELVEAGRHDGDAGLVEIALSGTAGTGALELDKVTLTCRA